MNPDTFAHAALAVPYLAASPAPVENEGNGNPFPYAAETQVPSASAFVNETWPRPQFAGTATQASSLAGLLPFGGSKMPVTTANSLPVRARDGMVACAGPRRQVLVTSTRVVVSNNRARHLAYNAAVALRGPALPAATDGAGSKPAPFGGCPSMRHCVGSGTS